MPPPCPPPPFPLSPSRPLRIAFYAPLKAPGHPVPSGDRLMARSLLRCLAAAGHQVAVVSELRAYLGDAQDWAGWAALQRAAAAEVARIGADWAEGKPDVWLCYHPYYKSPDLLGPELCQRFGVAYVTVEASLSARRDRGIWAEMQAQARAAVRLAAVNLSLTARDALGLAQPGVRVERVAPFIDTAAFAALPDPQPGHLVTVAMMRAGDKFDSYQRLAAWLALLPPGLQWRLSVVGDGPLRAQVQALFGDVAARVDWLGQLAPAEVAQVLARGSAYVWPGCGEAYGLAYLEAQAAGLPVVAQAVAGVPEVVCDAETGFLTTAGDDAAAAGAVARLLGDAGLQARMGQAARARVLRDHGFDAAVRRLDDVMHAVVRR